MRERLIVDSPDSRVRHNLAALAAEVRHEYFPEAETLPVEWGRHSGGHRRRSIRLGSYHRVTSVIRVHPRLSSRDVPSYFVQSIIHHEYLHHILGPSHDRRFHRHERRFRFFRESKRWLRENLEVLLGVRAKARRADHPRLRKTTEPQAVQLSLFG